MSRLPPWVPAMDTCLSQTSRPHTFTFCTLSRDGLPRARTCVFRSWLFNDRSTGVLLFTTDKRSAKMSDLTYNQGKFEACFYFPNPGAQFRLAGFAQPLSLHQHPTMAMPAAAPFLPPPPHFHYMHSQPQLASSPPSSGDDEDSDHDHWSCAPKPAPPTHNLPYPLYSPAWKEATSIYAAAAEHAPPPPTPDEWRAEYMRIWASMRPEAKASFRRPQPGQPLSPSNSKLIDAISRGVDGSHDERGLDNFIVMVMFVNSVDHLSDRLNRRAQYDRENIEDWSEQEVCP